MLIHIIIDVVCIVTMKSKLKILIFATLEEANPLINKLKINQVFEKPFKVFKNNELIVIISGIGKIRATAACAYAIGEFGKSNEYEILNIGAAGSLNSSFSIGDIRTIEMVADCTETHVKSKIKTPTIQGLKSATLLTSDVTILSLDTRKNLSHYGELVDMEGFAIAKTAAIFGKKVSFLKIVSDTPENTSKNEIIKNIQSVSQLLVDEIVEFILRGQSMV